MNESMVIIIESVSDHSADMQRNGKNGEMDVMGYQTQNFHVCPGAQRAFGDLVSRGLRGDQAEMLAQLAALTDDYLEIEVNAMNQGSSSMDSVKEMIGLGNAVFYHLGALAMDIDDESVISLFHFMPDHILKVMQLSSEGVGMQAEEEGPC
tara:strand:- start:3110 stop:3562 length:453 start_codon:yes stop_codon:yes gene_type:complete